MTARTGERAHKTGDFHCTSCSETVHVTKGDKIPPCPCGKNEFDSRTGEPGNQSRPPVGDGAGPGPLATEERAQLDRFGRLREEFAARLDSVLAWDAPHFLRDDWAGRNAELAAALLPRPAPDFLRNPVILYQMFVAGKYLAAEAPYVMERLPAPAWAGEDPVGDPPRASLEGTGIITSSNTVHTLHHLLRFQQATGRDLRDIATVVEWGGGYGNLAKHLVRLRGAVPTFVLIDTPVFAAVQWLYLSSILGGDAVVLQAEPGVRLRPGAVNVVPIGLVADMDVTADLFVSTWALNECTPAAQDHVVDRDFFGAEALLLAMHRGDPFERRVLDAGARAVPLGDFMPAQQYLVR